MTKQAVFQSSWKYLIFIRVINISCTTYGPESLQEWFLNAEPRISPEKSKINFWGRRDSTTDKVLALHTVDLGLIPITPDGPFSSSRGDPWMRTRSKPWAPSDVAQNQVKNLLTLHIPAW